MKKCNLSINARTVKTEELQYWDSYESFIQSYRFFLSSGTPCEDEIRFEKIIDFLSDMDKRGTTVTLVLSGLRISFTYEGGSF